MILILKSFERIKCFLKMIKTIITWNFNNAKIKVAMSDNCLSCIVENTLDELIHLQNSALGPRWPSG